MSNVRRILRLHYLNHRKSPRRRDSANVGAYHRANIIVFSGHVTICNMNDVNNGDHIADARVSTSLTNDEQGGSGSITKGNGTDSQDVIIRNNVSIDSNQSE